MSGDRYDALLDLARWLASTLEPTALFSTLHSRLRSTLPMESFVGALYEGERIRPVFQEGRDIGCDAFCGSALDRLGAGEPALGVRIEGGGSFIAAPLVRDGRLLGCIAAGRTAGAPYDMADAALLRAVGQLAGMALDGARLSLEAARLRREVDRLDAAARELGASLDFDEVVQRVAEQAQQLVGKPVVLWLAWEAHARAVARAGGARVRLGEERALPPEVAAQILGHGGGALAPVAWSGEPTGPWAGAVSRPDRAIASPAVQAAGAHGHGRALDSGSVQAADDVPEPWKGADAPRISIPLSLGQRLVGFLAVGPWTAEQPDEERIALLFRLAPHAASAIENARLHEEVRRLSLTDPLLQLPNRRQLDLYLEREFAAARRGRALCLILFDLDHFKAYNDAHGHREGDDALIRFAEVLRIETRSMNLAARYGGEEFAVVLSGANLLGGQVHAERVRRRIQREFGGRLTVSGGIAEYRPEMKSPIDLVVAADRALYRSKLDGRNRISVADG